MLSGKLLFLLSMYISVVKKYKVLPSFYKILILINLLVLVISLICISFFMCMCHDEWIINETTFKDNMLTFTYQRLGKVGKANRQAASTERLSIRCVLPIHYANPVYFPCSGLTSVRSLN